ncbi:MAG TPA: copper resistance protein NlpE [Lysobacter sp.]
MESRTFESRTFRRTPIALAFLAVLTVAGCQPATPPAEAPADASAEPTAVETPAPAAAADAAFDAKAFAGTFSGTLPCASCPGIETHIELAADGTFRLEETYQDEKDGHYKFDGTWTAEAAGKRIRLDPNSKDEDDRQFEVLSNDEIRMLDGTGQHIESTLPYNLKRATAG